MNRPICVKCEVEFGVAKNSVTVAEMFMKNKEIYKLWDADLWECPVCHNKIVGGFGNNAYAEHYKDDCDIIVENFKMAGGLVFHCEEVSEDE